MELITFFKTPAKNNEQRILKFFLIVILPLMGILTSITLIDYKHSKNEFLSKIVRDESANANKRIAGFFDPIFRDILFIQNQLNEDRLNLNNPEDLQDNLMSFAKFYLRKVKEVLLYDGQNTMIYPLNNPNSSAPTEYPGPKYEDLQNTLAANVPNEIKWGQGDYDPENKSSSILAETVFVNPKTKKPCVVSLNIDTTEFIDGLSKHMLSPKCLLLTDPDTSRPPVLFQYDQDGQPDLIRMQTPQTQTALKAWDFDENRETITFTVDGQRWQGAFLKLDIKTRNLYSALLVPESHILSTFRRGRLSLPIYASIVTAIALLATIFLWRRYQHELKLETRPPLLTEMSEDQLLDAINAGEGDQLEFKSTLRWNLKADKPGKEIEISALKTIVAFLNSEGGTLIVGVEDNGSILGIEADNFPNEDKFMLHFNNLIKQHIGLVASKFIIFKTRPLENKTILVVDCQKSDKPVFLKKDADENFYIRVGPGSRKLTFTETMNYLKKKR